MTQMIQTTQKTMHNQTLQKWATLSNTVTRYSLSQTLMSNALQYKASKGFRYIYYICRWCWGGGGGGFVIIFGRFGGGVLCNISPCEAHFSPPPPPPLLIIIAQSLIKRFDWIFSNYYFLIIFFIFLILRHVFKL